MKSLQNFITKHQKTHIIYDFDATIALLHLPWETVWANRMYEIVSSFDTQLAFQFKSGQIEFSNIQNMLISKFGYDAKSAILEHNIQFETTELEKVSLNKDLISYIRSSGLTQFIWTSNTAECILPILKYQNLDHVISTVITQDDVHLIKPESDGFDHIYDEDIPLEKYVFVGDSSADRNASQSAGIDFYHIDYFKK